VIELGVREASRHKPRPERSRVEQLSIEEGSFQQVWGFNRSTNQLILEVVANDGC
jgi:hypothetical protein